MFEYFKLRKIKMSYEVLLLEKLYSFIERLSSDEDINSIIELSKKLKNISEEEFMKEISKELIGRMKDE